MSFTFSKLNGKLILTRDACYKQWNNIITNIKMYNC